LGGKKLYIQSAQTLKATLRRGAGKQNLDIPAFIGRKHNAQRRIIAGNVCWVINPARTGVDAGKKALLFIHGGGYVEPINIVHWLTASKIVQKLGIPVWMPLYPLIPAVDLSEMNGVILEVYRTMLAEYGDASDKGITVMGDSAGAALSITLCHHIKANHLDIPLPASLILISPAAIGERDPAIVADMRAIEKRDVLLGCAFMYSLVEAFGLDISEGNYFTRPLHGDFRGFPLSHVFSGTDDIFYAQVPPFVERLKAAGVAVTLHNGKGMMHDWPLMPLAPECVSALDEILTLV
jgi:acetyl esterase/lipase